VIATLLAAPVLAQDVTEPRSGTRFPATVDGMSLLGAGLRTRTMLKVKVYAVGLYASDEALRGGLASFKGRTTSREFYEQLIWGDFGKQVTLKFLRDVTRDQIQGAFRDTLGGANAGHLQTFLSFFGDTKTGEEYAIRWTPGTGLVTTVAGAPRAVINDKDFAAAVYAVWLGAKPIQDDIKKDLVARAPQAIP
jgi:hypothetical protein